MPALMLTTRSRMMADTLAAGNLTLNPLYKEVKFTGGSSPTS